MAELYLASRSPRRRELLGQIGVAFETLRFRDGSRQDEDTGEDPLAGESPDAYVRRIARLKVDAAWARVCLRKSLAPLPVLAADTTVALADEILGKPGDAADAARMLQRLAGRQHRVLTAIAMSRDGKTQMRVSESHVTFCPLDEARIERYVATGDPFDKAGGYGIQGHAGAFVSRLDGSYSGVMGLPLFETVELLREFGLTVP